MKIFVIGKTSNLAKHILKKFEKKKILEFIQSQLKMILIILIILKN